LVLAMALLALVALLDMLVKGYQALSGFKQPSTSPNL
jgi:hypothetical protein